MRLAVDVLEREVGPAALVDAGVVEPGDVRVLEQRADVALARHALGQARAPGQARQLQRDLALQAAVGALGQPHRAHAAAADLADQPVRADDVAGLGAISSRARLVVEAAGRRP